MANNNTAATIPNLEVEYKTQNPSTVVNLVLDGMEQERKLLVERLRYLESTLLEHGRISERRVLSREEVRAR